MFVRSLAVLAAGLTLSLGTGALASSSADAADLCSPNQISATVINDTSQPLPLTGSTTGITNVFCAPPFNVIRPFGKNTVRAGDRVFDVHMELTYRLGWAGRVNRTDYFAYVTFFADIKGGKPSASCKIPDAYVGFQNPRLPVSQDHCQAKVEGGEGHKFKVLFRVS